MDLALLKEKFERRYGASEHSLRIFFAPGRVNLIGEHTDYNAGYVFPCALSYGTWLLVRESGDDQFSFASENFQLTANIRISDAGTPCYVPWVNYPLGIIDQFMKQKKAIHGLEFLYAGNIPVGAGLSSSGSIEMVTSYALNEIFQHGYTKKDLILMSQKCEHEFIGVQCGIMDQFSVAMGKKNHALFLNCKTLEYEQVPFDTGDYQMVLVNSNRSRELASSKYNERVKECRQAVEDISKEKPIEDLGSLDLESYRQVEHLIKHPLVRKRANHVVNENYRVKEAVSALKNDDLISFGKLMNASHKSLRDDYEVTGDELDLLTEIARNTEGVIGSRMTGAGFGGCTVNLVHQDHVEDFRLRIRKAYLESTGIEPIFYDADTEDGVREIDQLP